ncbi:SGNH/GDSL hydrolase family protein [Propionibacteriaceae bacterium Y2011]
MRQIERYVAIGDSATEGLADPDPRGGYRGWADRLAMILSQEGDQPVRYANLGIRGMVAAEVRALQFDRAMAMEPDLLTITAGINDCLALVTDFDTVTDHLTAMYSEARGHGITVMTFNVPDPVKINPLATGPIRERVLALNEIQRRECARYGVLLLDLEHYEIAGDRRLWYDDRLHGNALGHRRVAHGMASLLGLPGHDHWQEPLPEGVEHQLRRQRIANDLDWARQHFGPWLVKGLRGIRQGAGIEAKRPELTLVEVADPDETDAPEELPTPSAP